MSWDHIFLNIILVVFVPIVAGVRVAAIATSKRTLAIIAYTSAVFFIQLLYLGGRFEGAELLLRAAFLAILPFITGVAYLRMPSRWK
jgi:hypothetical protein